MIIVLSCTTFVVVLNETSMSVAIPVLMDEFVVSAVVANWLTTAFLLTTAIVAPCSGYVIKRFGTRATFFLSLWTVLLGTVVCALSAGLVALLVGRAIQAAGSALMMPLLMTSVMSLAEPSERGKRIGRMTLVISLGPAVGPVMSGLLISVAGWRWMFAAMIPVFISALAAGWLTQRNITETNRGTLDLLSLGLAVPGFGGLLYGLSTIGTASDTGNSMWFGLLGAAALFAFVARQYRLQDSGAALLDLRPLAARAFSAGALTLAVCMLGLFGTIVLFPMYLQRVQGLDAFQTGLIMVPGALAMGLLAPLAGRLQDKFGPKLPVFIGVAGVTLVFVGGTIVNPSTPLYAFSIGQVAMGMSYAMVFTPLYASSLASVPKPFHPYASAILATSSRVGSAAGVALFAAILTVRTSARLAEGLDQNFALAAAIRDSCFWGAAISAISLFVFFATGTRQLAANDVP